MNYIVIEAKHKNKVLRAEKKAANTARLNKIESQ